MKKSGRGPRPKTKPGAGETEAVSGVHILRWAHGGDGVAVPETGPLAGTIVFVPESVPGDVVDVRLQERKERWARGRIARVVTPSPERVAPPCELQGRCGGCPWMAGTPAAQARSREAILRGELGKRLGAALADTHVALRESPRQLGYRLRVRMGFEVAGGRVTLGFRGKKSHALVDVGHCAIADPAIDAALPAVREVLAARFAGGARAGRVTLLAGDAVTSSARAVAGWIEPEGGEGFGFGPSEVRVAFGRFSQVLSPRAFAQANAEVTGQILDVVEAWAREARVGHEEAMAVELFAGGGTLTMALWAAGWRVTAYEVDGAARAAFEATREAQGVPVERGSWHAADLFIGPPWPVPERPHLVVLDPPREGAKDVIGWVAASAAAEVLYVSCDLATGLRDVATLVQAGFRLDDVVGFDMFPHSGHQEVIFRLRRVG